MTLPPMTWSLPLKRPSRASDPLAFPILSKCVIYRAGLSRSRPGLCAHVLECHLAYRSGGIFRLCGLDRFCRICRDVDIHSHGCAEFFAESGRIWYSNNKVSLYRLPGMSLIRRDCESPGQGMACGRPDLARRRATVIGGPEAMCLAQHAVRRRWTGQLQHG